MLQHPANWTHNPQLDTRLTTCKPKRQVPQAATICITLELLMMAIMVPDTCWANNKFCNKETNLLHLVGLLISTYLYLSLSFQKIYSPMFFLPTMWRLSWHVTTHLGLHLHVGPFSLTFMVKLLFRILSSFIKHDCTILLCCWLLCYVQLICL